MLAVDLDGTLLRTDSLWELLLRYILPAPWRIFAVLACILIGGRVRIKRMLSKSVVLGDADVPWNMAVVEFCKEHRAKFGPVVLATAADAETAKIICKNCSFIDHIIGSTETYNLKGSVKAEKLLSIYGKGNFSYIGDSYADIDVWMVAKKSYFVGSGLRKRKIESRLGKKLIYIPSSKWPNRITAIFHSLRAHQWSKNLLVFLPLLAAHRWHDLARLGVLFLVFISISFVASAGYIFNDLADLSSDRRHPRKYARPIASGDLSIQSALILMSALVVLGLVVAALVGGGTVSAVGIYFVLSILYSNNIKTIAILDVVFLSGLYAYRSALGGFSANIVISLWLMSFLITFFLGMAFLKRYVELCSISYTAGVKILRRGYGKRDLNYVRGTGIAFSLLSVVVLALYLESPTSRALYFYPQWLWGIVFIFIFWIVRAWILAGRHAMPDDPVLFVTKDFYTPFILALCGLLLAMAQPL